LFEESDLLLAPPKKPHPKFSMDKAVALAMRGSEHRDPKPVGTDLSLPAIIRYRMKAEEQIKERCKRDYEYFLRLYFPKLVIGALPPFLKKIWEGVLGFGSEERNMDMLPQGPFGQWLIMLPTEHSKSTTLNILYPLMSLMVNPNETHLLAGSNEREASRWLKATRAQLDTNHELTRDFPWLKRPPRTVSLPWTTKELTIQGRDIQKVSPSYSAYGWESENLRSIRGKLVADDLEGMRNSLSGPDRERLYEAMQKEFIRCLQDVAFGEVDPMMIVAGTPFDVGSLYFRLAEEHGWKVYKQPYRYEDGTLIWPAKKAKISTLKRSLSKSQFAIAMKLDPTVGDPTAMTDATIKDLTERDESEVEGLTRFKFVFLDPAGGSKNMKRDYAGIGLVDIYWPAGEEYPKVVVSEPVAFRGGPMDQVIHAGQLAIRENVPVIYEVNGPQGVLYEENFKHFYGNRVRTVGHHTSGGPTGNRGAKDGFGLMVVKELVLKSKLRIVKSREHQEGVDALRGEIRNLGDPKSHDHLCAGIWFAVRHVFDNRRRRAESASVQPRRRIQYRPAGPMSRRLIWPSMKENR
jgi:hypothetical protein